MRCAAPPPRRAETLRGPWEKRRNGHGRVARPGTNWRHGADISDRANALSDMETVASGIKGMRGAMVAEERSIQYPTLIHVSIKL